LRNSWFSYASGADSRGAGLFLAIAFFSFPWSVRLESVPDLQVTGIFYGR
jgi:hypothetical protein